MGNNPGNGLDFLGLYASEVCDEYDDMNCIEIMESKIYELEEIMVVGLDDKEIRLFHSGYGSIGDELLADIIGAYDGFDNEVYDDVENGDYSPGKIDWPERKIEPRKRKQPDFSKISEIERVKICNEFLNESKFDLIYGPDSDGWYREYGFVGYDLNHRRSSKTLHRTLSDVGLTEGPKYKWVDGNLQDKAGNPAPGLDVTLATPPLISSGEWYVSGLIMYHTHVDEPDNINTWSLHGHSLSDEELIKYEEWPWQFSGVFDGDNKTYYQMDVRGNMTSMAFLEMWNALNCKELTGEN